MSFGLENSARNDLSRLGQRGRLGYIFFTLQAVVIIALVGYLYLERKSTLSADGLAPSGDYQAVFLNGGQVYFGKLELGKSPWLVLRDIYYLQTSQTLQSNRDQLPVSPANFQLIKLGSELHAPEDTMYINVSQVSYWENLSTGSRIIEAIKKYKASQ